MPIQSVEKVSYLKDSDFTAKGLSEFISLLGMSNSRLRDKCNSENFRIASEAAKNSNVRLNSAATKENIKVVCDQYLDPSMEFFIQPFISHPKELSY
jgi:hypothetical protein